MMQPEAASTPDIDPRHKAILAAAFDVFRLYGYRRTAMEDIAQAANMSRAALYQHYRNKDDIFRSLAQYCFDSAATAVAQVLAQDHAPAEALDAAFAAQSGEIVAALLTSPHGAELMDTKTHNSADIATAGEARLTGLYADWLTRQTQAGRITLRDMGSPGDLAATMMAALHGLKSGSPDFASYVAGQTRLARLFGRALSP